MNCDILGRYFLVIGQIDRTFYFYFSFKDGFIRLVFLREMSCSLMNENFVMIKNLKLKLLLSCDDLNKPNDNIYFLSSIMINNQINILFVLWLKAFKIINFYFYSYSQIDNMHLKIWNSKRKLILMMSYTIRLQGKKFWSGWRACCLVCCYRTVLSCVTLKMYYVIRK